MDYRNEIKYVCSMVEVESIKLKLSTVSEVDPNAPNGFYNVRSIYFDDYYNSSYYGNEAGVDPREKWRIRIYNENADRISIECKKKCSGKIKKESNLITAKEFNDILNDRIDPWFDDRNTFNRFKVIKATKLLRPAVIVQYQRFPYVCEEGNVRITLDCDISFSTDYNDFFSSKLALRPIQMNRQQLLEVKYDEFIPREITDSIQLNDHKQETFSKYYLCRKLSMEGHYDFF